LLNGGIRVQRGTELKCDSTPKLLSIVRVRGLYRDIYSECFQQARPGEDSKIGHVPSVGEAKFITSFFWLRQRYDFVTLM
jgi:hypothetical protein